MSSVNNVTDTANGASESQNTSTAAGNGSQTATTNAASTAKPPDLEQALRNALMLGWSIVELRSRIQIAAYKEDGSRYVPDSSLRRASVWRALFSRIAGLQKEAFPQGTTDGTLYQPPSKDDLPYLYPPAPDYADVGIIGKDINGAAILEQFKLYDVTRRAINCLSLLYVNKDDSLIPETIECNQKHLVKAILDAAKKSEAGGGDPAQTDASQQSKTTNTQTVPQVTTDLQNMQEAREVLTKLTVKFLNAWEGYLRETYYVGGSVPKDDLELVAFEAGDSLSSLSWNVSVETSRLDRKARDKANQQSDPATSTTTAPVDIIDIWKSLFAEKVVISIQHQITALSCALDTAFYQKHPELKPTKDQQSGDTDSNAIVVPNPDLPSQAIEAVKHGLDYWQRAVLWIPDNKDKLSDDGKDLGNRLWNGEMRVALIEQANIWQTLLTGQQSLRAYNIETATREIMQDVTEDIQKSLRTDFRVGLQQAEKAMKDVAQQVKAAVSEFGETAAKGLEELFKASVKFLWPVLAGIAVIFILLTIVAYIENGKSSGQAAMGATGGVGLTGIISAILGYFGLGNLTAKKDQQQNKIKDGQDKANSAVDIKTAAGATGASAASAGNHSLLTRIESAAEGAGATILKAIERGYEQIRVELDGLNHSVGVAYPLVECFLRNFQLKSDAEFLTKVIWDNTEREEELKRVMRAAFGPLALLVDPGGSPSGQSTGNEKALATDAT